MPREVSTNRSAALQIVALGVLATVSYGIAHDQVTARLCVEYFTIGHAPLFVTDSPTLLGIGWGIVATWWVGLLLGAGLAFAATAAVRAATGVAAVAATEVAVTERPDLPRFDAQFGRDGSDLLGGRCCRRQPRAAAGAGFRARAPVPPLRARLPPRSTP